MDFLDFLDLILSPAIAFIVGIMTAILGRNASRISISKERLEKVYHPLFLSIEPYLYKDVTFKEISSFVDCYCELEKKFSLFIYPSLRQHMNSLCKNKKIHQDDWIIICDYISKEYDRLCKNTYIPIRSTAYRLNYKQYKSKFSMWLGVLWFSLPNVLFLCLFYIIFLAIYSQILSN